MKAVQADDRSQMNVLDAEECRVLLRWEIVGRLGVSIPDRAPSIVPVNFVMDNDTVVFRTAKGEKYDHLVGHPVSLEVDRFDWYRRIGWSVLVQGVAEECTEAEVAGLELSPWAPGDKPSVIRIVPNAITGRRIELTTPTTDPRGYR
jgi:nitroimidazol reductase NimA-like FMN-containing flavoprotein (pyridoxamine 5'-phosphate oxidase superfamily)